MIAIYRQLLFLALLLSVLLREENPSTLEPFRDQNVIDKS